MIRFILAFCAGLLLTGCDPRTPGTTKGHGAEIASLSNLKPIEGASKAKLVPGGIEIPVEMTTNLEGDLVRIVLTTHGQVIEEEVYTYTDTAILLREAASETYRPPLEVLKAPTRLGESWDWKGTVSFGEVERKANAKISAAQDTVFPIRVTAQLSIDGGGPQPAQRILTFWFEPQKGVVKREFGAGLTRIPAGD